MCAISRWNKVYENDDPEHFEHEEHRSAPDRRQVTQEPCSDTVFAPCRAGSLKPLSIRSGAHRPLSSLVIQTKQKTTLVFARSDFLNVHGMDSRFAAGTAWLGISGFIRC